MKTKPKPKARRMWANYYPDGSCPVMHPTKSQATLHAESHASRVAVPGVFITLDDVDALVEKAMQAYADCPTTAFQDAMCAALTASGVLPKQRKGIK